MLGINKIVKNVFKCFGKFHLRADKLLNEC